MTTRLSICRRLLVPNRRPESFSVNEDSSMGWMDMDGWMGRSVGAPVYPSIHPSIGPTQSTTTAMINLGPTMAVVVVNFRIHSQYSSSSSRQQKPSNNTRKKEKGQSVLPPPPKKICHSLFLEHLNSVVPSHTTVRRTTANQNDFGLSLGSQHGGRRADGPGCKGTRGHGASSKGSDGTEHGGGGQCSSTQKKCERACRDATRGSCRDLHDDGEGKEKGKKKRGASGFDLDDDARL